MEQLQSKNEMEMSEAINGKTKTKQQTFSESMTPIGRDKELPICKLEFPLFTARTQPFSSGTASGLSDRK